MPRFNLLSLCIFLAGALAMTVPPANPAMPTNAPPPTQPDPEAAPTIPPFVVKYGNDSYQACGNFRPGNMLCPPDHVCIDNPRPSSCGQACDDHGVCVRRDAARCGPGLAACADGGRCRTTVFECVPRADGRPDQQCASLCFPDYWDGEPDQYSL